MDAKELIESIGEEKRIAIENGVLREEKKLAPIKDNEIPRKLPQGWEWCRLGDYAMKVTDYVASGSFASLKENVLITNEENYAVMVKTADFSNGFSKNLTYTDEKGYRFLENSNLLGGELILSNIGSIGKVFIVPDLNRPMTLASNTIMIRMTHNDYNKYMYYLFLSPYGQGLLQSISSGTSMLKFNKTQLKSTIIPIAPLETQNRICSVLDRLQSVINARTAELNKLDELIKARFVEMFSGESNMMKMSNVCSIITDGTHQPPKFVTEGIPFIFVSNVVNDKLTYDAEKFITQETYDELIKRTPIEIGDVLLSTVGSYGHPAVVESDTKFLFQRHIAYLKPKKEIIDSHYLHGALLSPESQRQIEEGVKGIAQKTLNLSEIKKMVIPVPDLSRQKQFSGFVKQVDKSKLALQQSLDETQLLFDSLMQEYFG